MTDFVNQTFHYTRQMKEITLNLHIHSLLSDGHATYQEIARQAADAGVDVIIITDHNVFPRGLEGYYDFGEKSVLVLTGEEIHNQGRLPQKNHLLAFNLKQDFSQLADRTQVLINRIHQSSGLSFLAHPTEHALDVMGEPDISWEDWSVSGFTGLELWNGMSEIKTVSHNLLDAVYYAMRPAELAHGPHPNTLAIWDNLLNKGQRCVAICGADAHCLPYKIGPFTRWIYPYNYHFRALNNHLLLSDPLTGNLNTDKKMLYDAMRSGRLHIGYDLPHSTTGFLFTAQGQGGTVTMGDEIPAKTGVTLQVKVPTMAKVLLFRNGKVVQRWKGGQTCAYSTTQEGVYRVEAWINFLGKRRGWIFSNPIYLR